ncbi:glycosyltransferase involved in cell wall biosynthesis [Anoxybacillus tepidamans]|uniref:Glycosyltransferase involved in cell wall biosynthesis n=1 Tax=Anoxybacteroides tepidamans TaxID=265948 RepID=A0A7W8IR66_9BACL|nr:glycosyltransferase [Anoxybacillus tepidamans]MBB5324204.1 glycosyltransferase involved in cell wall biosynthesis [Anoxybacillus tepidamans]
MRVLYYNLRKVINILKNEGMYRGLRIIKSKVLRGTKKVLIKRDINEFYSYILLKENPPKIKYKKGDCIRIAWFIPDFGIGSGGHLNIFRFVHLLEKNYKVRSDIYICGNTQWRDTKTLKEIVNKYFFETNANYYILNTPEKIYEINQVYDLAIATSWQTAYYVRAFGECSQKAYFVQDFEPYFYPKGSNYAFAEETYRFNFYGITAGTWLKEKLSNSYGMKCESFSFSYDKDIYKRKKRRDPEKTRIFFYSRPPTDRRGFELGLLALSVYCENNPETEVVMAGWDVSEYEIPFKHLNAGIVKIEELPDLYSQCDVALILSFTNLSLLPLELLASGCPVIINEGSNNSWIDNNKNLLVYTKATTSSINESLEKVLKNKEYRESLILNSEKFLEETSWSKEVDKVYKFIVSILEEK